MTDQKFIGALMEKVEKKDYVFFNPTIVSGDIAQFRYGLGDASGNNTLQIVINRQKNKAWVYIHGNQFFLNDFDTKDLCKIADFSKIRTLDLSDKFDLYSPLKGGNPLYQATVLNEPYMLPESFLLNHWIKEKDHRFDGFAWTANCAGYFTNENRSKELFGEVGISRMIGIDLNKDIMEKCSDTIKSTDPKDMKIEFIEADVLDRSLISKVKATLSSEPVLSTILGNSLANFSSGQIRTFAQIQAELIKDLGGCLIIGNRVIHKYSRCEIENYTRSYGGINSKSLFCSKFQELFEDPCRFIRGDSLFWNEGINFLACYDPRIRAIISGVLINPKGVSEQDYLTSDLKKMLKPNHFIILNKSYIHNLQGERDNLKRIFSGYFNINESYTNLDCLSSLSKELKTCGDMFRKTLLDRHETELNLWLKRFPEWNRDVKDVIETRFDAKRMIDLPTYALLYCTPK